MPQSSKYVPAPFKKTAGDPYGDPEEVFASRLMEVAAAVGLQNAFYPSDTDVDNGSPNLLDHPDHTFFMTGPKGKVVTVFNRSSGVDPTPGAPNNWLPQRIYSSYIFGENYGATDDLPSEPAPPAWYKGGSVDLWNSSNNNYLLWDFSLEPNTTYTFSFYYKKLGDDDWTANLDAGSGTSGSSAYDLYQDADGLPAALGTWARKVITFTTTSSGVVHIYLGGRGSWDGSEHQRGLRVAFPQLEQGDSATAWRPPRFWVYHELPAPITIDETIDPNTNYASLLTVALPGSAVAFKLDARPNWTDVSISPRSRRTWQGPVAPNTSDTTTMEPSYDVGGASHPMLAMVEPRPNPGLGLQFYSVVRYGSDTPRTRVEIRGVWVKHKQIGGLLKADSSATSGAGHTKTVAWRVTDLGNHQFRAVFATTNLGPYAEHTHAVDVYWHSAANELIYDNSQNSTSNQSDVRPHTSIGVLSLDLHQDEDLFIDAIGNAQGLALAFYQAGAYKVPLVLADFLDPPAPGDDGSVWARWGMLTPHNRVGYKIAAAGPLARSYQIAAGRNFHTPTGWNHSYATGEAPIPYFEFTLGVRVMDRLHLFEPYVARSDSVASNRGRLANIRVARGDAFNANLGDSWLAQDGSRYVFIWKEAMFYGESDEHLLFIKP